MATGTMEANAGLLDSLKAMVEFYSRAENGRKSQPEAKEAAEIKRAARRAIANAATSADTTYQGWTNYETWAVKLFMDNDRPTYEFFRGVTKQAIEQAPNLKAVKDGIWTVEFGAKYSLGELVKIRHESTTPKLKEPFAALLQGALDSVNWGEIAASLIETETNG